MKRELSRFEQDTLIEALTQIDAAGKAQKLAEHAAAIESERAGRIAAEGRVGELMAEMNRRGVEYRSALADMETKHMQEHEARMTADLLAAQYRAEAETERAAFAQLAEDLRLVKEQCDQMMEHMQSMPMVMEATPSTAAPVVYRATVVARDGAGDLKSIEFTPVERK